MQEVIKYRVEEAVEEAAEEIKQQVTQEVTRQVTQEVTQQVTQEVTEKVELGMANLIQVLLNEERYEDLKRVTTDREYRKKLMAEYQIGMDQE